MRADYVDKLANPDQPMHPGSRPRGEARGQGRRRGARRRPRTSARRRARAAPRRSRREVQAPTGGQDARLLPPRPRCRPSAREARPEGERRAGRQRAGAPPRGGRATRRARRRPRPSSARGSGAHALTSLKGALARFGATSLLDVLELDAGEAAQLFEDGAEPGGATTTAPPRSTPRSARARPTARWEAAVSELRARSRRRLARFENSRAGRGNSTSTSSRGAPSCCAGATTSAWRRGRDVRWQHVGRAQGQRHRRGRTITDDNDAPNTYRARARTARDPGQPAVSVCGVLFGGGRARARGGRPRHSRPPRTGLKR